MQKRGTLASDEALGIILVDVLAPGSPERYWQYRLELATGNLNIVKQQTFQDYRSREITEDYQRPAGAIETCAKHPRAISPDGRYVATCASNSEDEFSVTPVGNNPGTQPWRFGKQIRGFAWAPNSKEVAVLGVAGRVGTKPGELVAFLTGHPVSHDTVFIEIVNINTGHSSEYVIRENVVSAFTRILNWSP